MRLGEVNALARIHNDIDGRDVARVGANQVNLDAGTVVAKRFDAVFDGRNQTAPHGVGVVIFALHQVRADILGEFIIEPDEMDGNVGGVERKGAKRQTKDEVFLQMRTESKGNGCQALQV